MSKRLITPLLFILVFLTALMVYLNTLAPTFTFGDSGELISMIKTLGIAHPTGFPLYILLGKVFSLFPLANPAFKINFMSAIFGALTPALLFLALSVFFNKEKNKLISGFIALTLSLLFIFTYTLWSQAVMSRIYTLNAAFCAAILLLFFLYNEHQEESKYLYLWALLTGLGVGLHLTLTAFSGILWLHLAITKFDSIKKNIIWLVFFLAIGLSAFAYLVIRANSDALLKWADINTIKNFLSYITQEQYNIKKFARGISGVLTFFNYVKDVLLREISPLALILFIVGVIMAFMNKFKYTITFLLIFLSSITMLLFYGNYTDLKLAFRYMIPSYIIMFFFIAYFFHSLFSYIKNTPAMITIISLFIIFIFSLSIKLNSYEANKSNNYVAYNYATDILTCLPDTKSGLFASGDNNIYPLAYFKFVLNKKPALSVYDNILTVFKDSLPLLEKSKSTQTTHNVLTALSLGYTNLFTISEIGSQLFTEIPSGLLFKISDKYEEPNNKYWKIFSLKGITWGAPLFHDFEEREIIGTYLYREANYYKSKSMFPIYESLLNKAIIESYDSIAVLGSVALIYSSDPYIQNYFEKAEKLFLKCYSINPENFNLVFNLGSFYGRFSQYKKAAYYFELAGRLDPYNYNVKNYLASALSEYRRQLDKEDQLQELSAHFENGRNLIKTNKFDEALIEFEKDIKLNPKLGRSFFHLGLIYSMKGDYKLAIPKYEMALKLEPTNVPALDNLGLVYIRLKDYKKARFYFEKSLAIDPAQDRLIKDLAKLKQLGY
ncbi:MAG: DUF2723 domain-containing protein [bacterium]